jgi:hypothetical protein
MAAAVASGATVLGLRQLHQTRHYTRFSMMLFVYSAMISVALSLYAVYNTVMVVAGVNQYQLLQWLRLRHKEGGSAVRKRDMRV